MLKEHFVASTLRSERTNASSPWKDVGICLHELQPQCTLRHGYKKSSTMPKCLAISESHIFAAQSDKAVVHVCNRDKGTQEALVPFPDKVRSLAYAGNGSALLVIGTEGGRLILWELASGRQVTSLASHLQAVSSVVVDSSNNLILSGSADSNVHVWPLLKLISFPPQTDFTNNNALQKLPIRTFSNHRSAITAIACGHSRMNSNYAVSSSDDNTCYVWSLDNCEVLRTILLPAVASSFVLDPADRVVYAGFANGSVHKVDLYGKTITGSVAFPRQARLVPLQLESKDSWGPSTTGARGVNTLSLSYDATILLSGHEDGKILSWDVAKGRVQKAVVDMGHPVTNVFFLQPTGLPKYSYRPAITTVVKPRLESSTTTAFPTLTVPPSYSLQIQLATSKSKKEFSNPDNEFSENFVACLTSSKFPRSYVEEASRALFIGRGSVDYTDPNKDLNLAKMERLEDQIAELNQRLQSNTIASER